MGQSHGSPRLCIPSPSPTSHQTTTRVLLEQRLAGRAVLVVVSSILPLVTRRDVLTQGSHCRPTH
jgi:hypothetical protein